MSKPINLNRARKARARQEKRQKADENAVIHGRTKAQKATDDAARESLQKHLDQQNLRPDN
ncbi:DUF4169 family protein [Actibacterium sp. 188UL27-1]|uniref:DUF4169 family protein n=1 Tax=Actibacterium sp. 188UL27-1 TaxID=2786961 RepID=UPI00195EF6EE|nr:DUF4169 family protein [Actibacterium sp. 188UL27-1]MBM7067890.1 DUF4169 family protein [Actibacterium sp. 188UL27-1]